MTLDVTSPAGPWVLLALLALCLVDGFFPPVPSESLVIALSAAVVATGGPPLWAVWLTAAVGAVLGDHVAFAIGRRVGRAGLARRSGDRWVAAFDRAERLLAQRGAVVLVTARHVPVGRVAVTMSAGASSLPWRRFTGITLVSGALWAGYGVAIGALTGYWLGDRPLLAVALGIALALVVGLLVDAGLRRHRQRAEAARSQGATGPGTTANNGCGSGTSTSSQRASTAGLRSASLPRSRDHSKPS